MKSSYVSAALNKISYSELSWKFGGYYFVDLYHKRVLLFIVYSKGNYISSGQESETCSFIFDNLLPINLFAVIYMPYVHTQSFLLLQKQEHYSLKILDEKYQYLGKTHVFAILNFDFTCIFLCYFNFFLRVNGFQPTVILHFRSRYLWLCS